MTWFMDICAGIMVILVATGVIASIKMAVNQGRFAERFDAFQVRMTQLKDDADKTHARIEMEFRSEDLRIREQLLAISTSIKADVAVLINDISAHRNSPHWRQEDYEFFKKSTLFQNEIMSDLHTKSDTREVQIRELIEEMRNARNKSA